MSRRFDEEHGRLKSRLLGMADKAGEMIESTIAALDKSDLSLLESVSETEEQLDAMQRSIDEEAIRLIGVYTPVAADLRSLLMVTRINAELERIGDQSMNISFYARKLAKEAPLQVPETIIQMGQIVGGMLKTTMQAYTENSSKLAIDVVRTDDKVDEMNNVACKQILRAMRTDCVTPVPGLELVLIAYAFERMGDHTENIAEDVYYLIEGRDIRHRKGAFKAN